MKKGSEAVTELRTKAERAALLQRLDDPRYDHGPWREPCRQLITLVEAQATRIAVLQARLDQLNEEGVEHVQKIEDENARLKAMLSKATEALESEVEGEREACFEEIMALFDTLDAVAEPDSVPLWATCDHDWREVDSQFSSEDFTDVECSKCGCRGQRMTRSGDVFFPAT